MNIAIRCTAEQQEELRKKGFIDTLSIHWIEAGSSYTGVKADAFFDLSFNDTEIEQNEFIDDYPVFVHAVNCTCEEIGKFNYIRLNAWKGFLNRPVTELACNNEELKIKAATVFNALQWQYAWVMDHYGLIAPRVVSMIINEAYYALEQKISSKEEIDIAMKLGTNYPFGPFEWGRRIGLVNIRNLLKKLFEQNQRYLISPLLVQESQQF
jgi:3-hydroxybutyryl-CoA dehydrogenase